MSCIFVCVMPTARYTMLGRPCSCCRPRVRSGRAGGLVLLCSLTLILGWLGSSCPAGSWVAPQLDRWPRMKAFLFKLYYLCRLAMQSRYLLFSEGFRESCLMPLRPALDSLHSLPQITILLIPPLGPAISRRHLGAGRLRKCGSNIYD